MGRRAPHQIINARVLLSCVHYIILLCTLCTAIAAAAAASPYNRVNNNNNNNNHIIYARGAP